MGVAFFHINLVTYTISKYYVTSIKTLNIMSNCNCEFCQTYKKFVWAEIMNCKCGCHNGDGLSGHDSLCCSIPNGLKKNNPFTEELDYNSLKSKMIEFENEANKI